MYVFVSKWKSDLPVKNCVDKGHQEEKGDHDPKFLISEGQNRLLLVSMGSLPDQPISIL